MLERRIIFPSLNKYFTYPSLIVQVECGHEVITIESRFWLLVLICRHATHHAFIPLLNPIILRFELDQMQLPHGHLLIYILGIEWIAEISERLLHHLALIERAHEARGPIIGDQPGWLSSIIRGVVSQAVQVEIVRVRVGRFQELQV